MAARSFSAAQPLRRPASRTPSHQLPGRPPLSSQEARVDGSPAPLDGNQGASADGDGGHLKIAGELLARFERELAPDDHRPRLSQARLGRPRTDWSSGPPRLAPTSASAV